MHRVARILYETMPFQILQTPKQVLFMFQWNREFRLMDIDVAHTDPPGPMYEGQSVGHWDGNVRVTLADPKVFARSWSTSARFRKLRGARLSEDTCIERLKRPQYQ